MMTTQAHIDNLVAAIDAISGGDPECAHGELDDLILAEMPVEVYRAAARLRARCNWWACA